MRTGKLNKRITIQKLVETQNATKEMERKFIFFTELWASIEPASSRDFLAAQQLQSDVSTKITVRHYEGLNKKMRVVYQRQRTPAVYDVFEIDGVLPNKEDRREMFLMCRKIDAEGFRVDGTRGQ